MQSETGIQMESAVRSCNYFQFEELFIRFSCYLCNLKDQSYILNEQNIIFYNTADGKGKVALMAKDGQVWMNQNQMAELFATSTQNVSLNIINILKEIELSESSVVKDYLITAAD